MAKWAVTHLDGRVTYAFAPDADGAKKHANFAETSRHIIAGRRGVPERIEASLAVSAEKVKD